MNPNERESILNSVADGNTMAWMEDDNARYNEE